MIPEGWKQELANDLCSQISVGIVVKPADYYVDKASGIRAFRSANVGEGFVKDRDWIYISEVGNRINRKSVLRTNDVLIVRTGYPGTACLVPPEYEGSNCIDIIFARPEPDRIIPSYLCVFTNSEYGKKQVLDGQGGLAQQHFNVGAFKEIKIPLPPLPEQRRITEILSTWDRAIDTVEALISNARAQKEALMQYLLTGQHRLPGFSEEWATRTIGEAAEITTGRSKSEFIEHNGKYLIIDMGSVTRTGALVSNKPTNKSEDVLVIGDLIMPKDDIGGGNIIGRVAKIDREETYVLGDHVYLLRAKAGISPDYLQFVINSYCVNKALRRKANGTAQLGLGKIAVQKTAIRIPDYKEQCAIAAILMLADRSLMALLDQLFALRQEKSALMQQLLTGKRRVKVSEKEAAHD